MKIVDLGRLDGDLCLFGGPYSNAHALRGLFGAADGLGIGRDHMICTGDIIAYCAEPDVCLELMMEIHTIAGNCEKQLAEGAADCGCGFEEGTACDIASRAWFPFAQDQVAGWTAHLGALPDILIFTHHAKRYAVIHGGVHDIARFIWPNDNDAVFVQEIDAIEALCGPVDAVITGHCGLTFVRPVGRHLWINAGVIGMPPNDGRPETRYAILSQGQVAIKELSYDHIGASDAMRAAGLVQGYQDALTSGIWPAQDILPHDLRR